VKSLLLRRSYMKFRIVIAMIALFMLVMTGCGKKDGNNATTSPSPSPTKAATATTAPTTAPTTPAATTAPTTAAGETPDAVTTASIVDNEEAFLKAISKTGTWIICLTKDLSTDKELLLEGEFKNGKKDDAGKDIIQRKIALYAQDENRNITARYKLTAPKLTISSPMASVQKGTFKGDIYVTVSDFELVDATIEGNVYFTTEEAQKTFKMDETSKITGKKEMVKEGQ
jgi:hypothetical protein